jgi:LCP family protein required for cell wall assembly
VFVAALALLLSVPVVLLAGAYVATSHYAGNIERIPDEFVFPQGPDASARPAPATPAPGAEGTSTTFLLVGSDARSPVPTTGDEASGPVWTPGAQRADTILLAHLPASGDGAYVISIPRDSWVQIPGRGMDKINAAYSYGGPPLLIATLEQLTGVRIDHFAAVDFAGFERMTDAVGGVTVPTEEGPRELDGEEALSYVRARYELPRGDLDRVQRQQAFLRALMGKVASGATLTDPAALNRLLDAVADSVSVDAGLSNADLRSYALRTRSLAGNTVFLTAPVSGLGMEGQQSVVYLDEERSAALWEALRTGTMPDFLERYETDQLGPTAP